MKRFTLFALLLAACGGSDPGGSTGGPEGPTLECPAGSEPTASGDACQPIVAGECAPGSMPRMGERECQPVGPTSCAAGFEPDPSGWGCAAVAPERACEGATRDALGSRSCTPVGDCAAAFPPPGATHVVRPAGGGGAYTRILDALAAAPAGAVIAVDRGTYREALRITRGVRIVGRCAGEVTIEGNGQYPGIEVAASGVTVEGVTMKDQAPAILVTSGSVDVSDVVVTGARSMGIDAASGTRVKVARSAVRHVTPIPGYLSAGIAASGELEVEDSSVSDASYAGIVVQGALARATLEGVVLRDGAPDENLMGGVGINLAEGAQATVTRAWLHANTRAGYLGFRRTKLTMRDTVIDDTKARASRSGSEVHGEGVAVFDGASATLERLSVARTVGVGLRVIQNASATVRSSVIRDTKLDENGDLGAGAYVHAVSKLVAEDTAFVGNRRAAVEVYDPGTEVVLERSLLAGTRSSHDGKNGLGIHVMRAKARISKSAVVDNRHTGIYLWEAAEGTIEDTVVRDTALQENPEMLGHGLLVQGVPSVTVRGSEFAGSASTGLVFSDSTATVFGTWIRGNAVGLHAQDGCTLTEATAPPDAPEPLSVVVGSDTRFADNGSRLGSGVVPLAEPLRDPGKK